MCVIIYKKAGADIPANMMETACDINKDGFGLSFVAKKKITTMRSIAKNDHKAITAEVAKLKDKECFLHLRHSTVGKVSMENSHPFFPLSGKDGLEVGFMHNGTLTNFTPSKDTDAEKAGLSDSYQFNHLFLRPFLIRLLAYNNARKHPLLDDWMVQNILSRAIGAGGSVFLLFDNLGHHLKVDGFKGEEYEWGWASNKYSFDTEHHRSSNRKWNNNSHSAWNNGGRINTNSSMFRASSNGSAPSYGSNDDGLPWEEWHAKGKSNVIELGDWRVELEKMDRESQLVERDWNELQKQIEKVGSIVRNTDIGKDSMMDNEGVKVVYDMKRTPFLEAAGIRSYNELFKLSRDNFESLMEGYPRAMADCLLDLLAENKKLNATVEDLMDKKSGVAPDSIIPVAAKAV